MTVVIVTAPFTSVGPQLFITRGGADMYPVHWNGGKTTFLNIQKKKERMKVKKIKHVPHNNNKFLMTLS